jgi:transposase
LEKRRRHAVMLLRKGRLSLQEVARRVRSSASSVHRWWKAWRKKGVSGLDAKPAPGRPRKLTDRERERFLEVLAAGAIVAGFSTEVWTLKRIALVIQRKFGVSYHPCHVWKVMRSCGWSCQAPDRRALQRDEDAIENWKRNRWPAIKKSRKTWSPPRVSRRERFPPHPDAT